MQFRELLGVVVNQLLLKMGQMLQTFQDTGIKGSSLLKINEANKDKPHSESRPTLKKTNKKTLSGKCDKENSVYQQLFDDCGRCAVQVGL